ncbi:MAG: PTS sugar transporter subunit IIA [Oscillospiraceae bacterium]|nr:PTS sugar transporter subunit IIA [Oscillospiraceae bacterium]
MNQRVNTIAHILNDSRSGTSISKLAEQFQVSQRTIRNDLKELNTLLQQNNQSKLSIGRDGQVIPPEDFEQIIPYISAGGFYDYKLSPEERIQAAAAMLVSASGYVTLAEIAENLFVSRATVINDLEGIKRFIGKGGLALLSRANKGLYVTGKESDKRSFLLRLIRDKMEKGQSVVGQHISVQAGDPVVIQKIISEQEHVHEQFLTDSSFQDIRLYLGIMINRNQQGELLEPQSKTDGEKYPMAQDILRYISQYCGVTTTENDIYLLCDILNHARYIRQSSFEKDAVKIQMITRQFIDCISDELELDLNNDYDFFENLSNHLESIFSASVIPYPDQAVMDEVLEENRTIVEVIRRKIPVISTHINREMTEMEIIYIAIHVCAAIERKKNKEIAFHVILACHAGIGTSQLLVEKLKKHFHFQIVDVISSHEAQNISEDNADFIISTVPLRNCRLDYVIVSPTFNDSDYVRVGSKIDALRNSRHLPSRINEQTISAKGVIERIRPVIYREVPNQAAALMKLLRREIRDYFNQSAGADAEIFSPYLHHLLSPDFIELDVACSDWRDAVRRSGEKLVERGYIETRYIDAMISNIEENGPYIVLSKGFAVPHEGLEAGSIRVGMYMIRLKTPVSFGAEELDPVEFVCCLSAVDHKTHLKAFFNLVNMLHNEEFKEMLHCCQTPEEAAVIIEKYEYGTLG